MKQTSLNAYEYIKPVITPLQEEVIAVLSLHPKPMSREEIISNIGRIKDTVAPRITELLNKGILNVAGHSRNSRGRSVELLSINEKWAS